MISEWLDEEGKISKEEESWVEIILSFSEVVSCLEKEESEGIYSVKTSLEVTFFSSVVAKYCSLIVIESSFITPFTEETSLE